MSGAIAKLAWALFAKIMTETFVSKMLAIGAWRASQMSSNDVDDRMAEAFAEALGVDESDYK